MTKRPNHHGKAQVRESSSGGVGELLHRLEDWPQSYLQKIWEMEKEEMLEEKLIILAKIDCTIHCE